MGKYVFNIDWLIVTPIAILTGFSLFVLLTIDTRIFIEQLIYIIIAFVLMVIISRIDASLLLIMAPYFYVFTLLFLGLSFLGPQIRGATRWLTIFGIQMQPSEIVKPLFIIFFSWVLVKYPLHKFKHVILSLMLFMIPFVLIFKQPDLGSSIVYLSIWISMMIASGLSLRFIIGTVLMAVLLLPLTWNHLATYQQLRVLTFINPLLDPKGAGYNALQSTIAVGSGQFFGRGLGLGTQSHLRFLPEHHTDFVFATLVEEMGFVGGIIIFLSYFILLLRILYISWKESDNSIIAYMGTGLFAMVFSQAFINIGMNMSILPITGITLPFVSAGGSSIISLAITFGFLSSLKRGLPFLS